MEPFALDTCRPRPKGLLWYGNPGNEEYGEPQTWRLDLGPAEGDTHWMQLDAIPEVPSL
jgi:hypothetical protein